MTRSAVRRSAYTFAFLVVAGAGLWALTGAASPSATPYSPSSTSPNGAKGLALLLKQLGDDLRTSGPLPPPGHAVALLLFDQLDDAARAQVTSWVRRGGALVVADPSSPLAAAATAYAAPDQVALASSSLSPHCAAPWVAGVSEVDPEGGPLLEVPSGAYACFPEGRGDAFAVGAREGAGVVVSIGSAGLWSNSGLADEDNALLAADLLAPGRGYQLDWLTVPWVAGGNRSLWGLVPLRIKLSLAGLGAAIVVACLWQARRLGRPVAEHPLVPLPGSELVIATGRLLARNRRYEEAAALLRAELCSQLRSSFGQGAGTSPTTLATVVAARTGMPRDEVMAALDGPAPKGERELLGLARSLQVIRDQALGPTMKALKV